MHVHRQILGSPCLRNALLCLCTLAWPFSALALMSVFPEEGPDVYFTLGSQRQQGMGMAGRVWGSGARSEGCSR